MFIIKYSPAVLLVCLALSGAAMGGILPLDSAAYNDGTTTWSGADLFSSGGVTVAEMDYAVYAPGAFNHSAVAAAVLALSGSTGIDPSNNSEYVYAYQLFNVSPVPPQPITGITVGLANIGSGMPPTDKQVANQEPIVVSAADFLPSHEQFNGSPASSAIWNFTGASQLTTGENSSIVIFTSPFSPHWDVGSVKGVAGVNESVPSPAPEPSTALLVLAGGAFAIARFRCRRRA